ncbi:Putative uncharacterized protein [Mycoavidus cysteinexigens]|uniref:Uncharacterized protein n=1 Tax=Mycoavidus cysteinexigens TaxID=1553431 RepID=A0A2Z6EVX1_9BURK|nr:NACHT domain-containing protein [Mycoavidus cysteinexigens]BBE09571.1 Putative uncharacterized protein [Mycoavidus cysteinexigens]GAM51664.1 hypothetical protein EBME_0127 [bacterium endosymbiont of Mortierella elongata FMR23-6]GLR01047.1 hypothetical protein GCM10007934_08590 [Mycoavidus cysteinexigens]
MLPVSGSKIPQTSNALTPSNLRTQIEAIHEQASGDGQSIVQASENCVVSNQLYGESHTVTTNFFLTASDSNTKLIFEKLNVHAEAARYKPLAQLGTHIEELKVAYLNALEEVDVVRDALALYVPCEGQESAHAEASFALIEKVRDFLSSEKKVLLLLGEAGSGKSTFNQYLARTLWEEYQRSSEKDAPLPLFIALAEHNPSCEDLIESYLLEQKFSQGAIDALRKEKRCIFILDGFDEIKDRSQAFYTHNRLDRWNAKVIISSRPEYLGKEYSSQFQKRGQTSALQEYWISPISDNWIEAYIKNYIRHAGHQNWNFDRYLAALNRLPTLKEAIRRPFLLRMALDLLPDLTENESTAPITRIALYDEYVSRWWSRSEVRLQHIKLTDEEKKALEKLRLHLTAKGLGASQKMATALTKEGLIQAFYEPENGEVVPEAWRAYFEDDAEKRLLLFNAPLIHRGQYYRFIHKSIQDYLVARAICGRQFSSKVPDVKAELNKCLLVDEPLILDFLVERIGQHPLFKKYLHAWIEASKDSDAVTVGAANAITVLVRAGVQFNGADLRGIRIRGADLRGGEFDHAQLQGADLREVNLRSIWLNKANLIDVQMEGAKFGERPFLKAESKMESCASYSPSVNSYAIGLRNGRISVYDTSNWKRLFTLEGHTSSVNSVNYSPSGTQIISVSSDNTVRMWDAHSGAACFTLEGHTDYVTSVVYSPNGRQIASGSWDKTVRLWDAESGAAGLTLEGHTDSVSSVVYSPSGAQIASGSDDKTVRLWDAESGAAGLTLEGHTDSVSSVVYSPSGAQLASGSSDKTVRVWDVKNGELIRTLKGHAEGIRSVVYLPSGISIASVGVEGEVRVWDADTGDLLQDVSRSHSGSVYRILYSPQGDQIVSDNSRTF